MAKANTSELLYHIFASRSRDIIIDIFLSFVAEANANAILYLFHFQTLHTAFLVTHSDLWQRLTQVNYSNHINFLVSRSRVEL